MKLFADIRERLEKATPGPWEWGVSKLCRSRNYHKLETNSWEKTENIKIEWNGDVLSADKKLIANSPTDIARLLSAVDLAVDTLSKIGSVDMPSASDKTAWIVMCESIGVESRQTLTQLKELSEGK